jgi:hypothetical protein
MEQSSVIVIALDESGSMSGSRWNNAQRGLIQLVDYIRNNHTAP